MGTNVCIFEGRLTRDSEYTTFGQNATPKLTFSLANNYGFGDYKKVNYIDCEIIGKKADSIGQYMTQGKAVNIVAEYHQQRWETEDGQKKSRPLFHVLNVSFTSGSNDNQNSNNQGSAPSQNNQNHQQSSNSAPVSNNNKKVNPFQAALAASGSGGAPANNEPLPNADNWEDDIPF